MKNLYVLLVGINEYPSPLPSLHGCIRDIDQIQRYLVDYCSKDYNLKIKRLDNSIATYSNIISEFRNHLGAAGPDDIAWFHYSGHGSEEKAAPEFLTLEPNGKDQTLICVDSGPGKANHLADKELAVLLNELATKNAGGPPHILVSLDCCHSGSGTRSTGQDIAWTTRAAPSSGMTRTLDSYIDGYFSKQQKLEIPSAKHLLLSACKSVQLAGDMPQGGAFTTGLIKALEAARGDLSYNDLFLRARAAVTNVRENQTPQFETIQNFDPYVRFLEGSPAGERDLYEVIVKDGDWYVKCGAIHGLPTSPAKPIELDIYSLPPEKELKGSATIKSVGAQLSRIDMEGNFGVGHFLRKLTNDEHSYRASIRHLPTPPELVKVTGEEKFHSRLESEVFQKSRYVKAALTDEPATLEVQIAENLVTVIDRDKKRKAYVTDGTSNEHLLTVRDALDKIVLWRRMIELENKNLSSGVGKLIKYELHETDEEGNVKKHTSDIRIHATSANLANRIPAFLPVVHVYNAQQPLYFYLFFIAFDYSVSCPGGEVVYRAYEYEDKTDVVIPLWKKSLGWGPAKDNPEDTCVFKLLVTTEPLDYQQFLQSGLGIHRDILGEPTPQKLFDDWASYNVAVTMVRQDSAINPLTDLKLADGQVTIKAHPSLNGNVSIGNAETNTRSTNPIHAFGRLAHDSVQLVDFSPSRSMQTQNVIEINNIRLTNEDALTDNPLEIHLNQPLSPDEMLLPVAFDGEYFYVVGDAVADGEGTSVRIHSIPDRAAAPSDGMGERSILKSLKMTFCKVSLGQSEVNQLRWVEKLPDGKIALQRESLGIKIGKAKKILLILHGLAGDGLSMTQSIMDNMLSSVEKYDLILVYDYESLNTPLNETAGQLKKTLSEYGFGQDDRKVTIISHSIGGLIARWMIEQEGGNAFVEHCILVGTPNNGSMYGRIDAYVKWAQTILDLAINFIPKIVPFSGILLKFLKGATDISGSIAQIDPDSDFINKLNSSKDPAIRYSVISGDAAGVHIENNGFDGFIKTSQQRLGKYMNGSEPNDLFAPVRSLQCKELWEGRQGIIIPEPVANYHFGYFMTPSGTRDTNTVWKQMGEVLE